ncbi:MAG: peroxiredoxin-like family protein [Hyphomicrobium sp.]|uniref:peroxiredoxin-like family protein n=1 Tax=Hyphomicrobium sp. TaxID=82 RepID=UPI0039E360A7
MTQAATLAEAFSDICLMDAPLNTRLAAYASKLRELNFPFSEAYDDLVARLYAGEVGHDAPSVGTLMPSFMLPSRSGALVSLEDLVANGPLVISFNRGHWCPFCKIELSAISEYHSEIERAGAYAVSIMPDRQSLLGDLRAMTRDAILILTDIDNGYALSLGLAMWVGENLKSLMRGRGYHLDAFQGNDGWFLPLPATFVVGRDSTVLARFVDPDFRKRMEIDEILAALNTGPR